MFFPMYSTMNIDVLLMRSTIRGIGCHFGHHFVDFYMCVRQDGVFFPMHSTMNIDVLLM